MMFTKKLKSYDKNCQTAFDDMVLDRDLLGNSFSADLEVVAS